MSTTYVNEGDRITPANVNSWLNRAGGEVFNVKAYGAEGDGVTDDSTALQAAIDAAEAAGGGRVFLPPGDYLFATGLVIDSPNVILVGDGDDSVLTYTGSGTGITISAASITLQNLKIDTTGASGTVAVSSSASKTQLVNVFVSGTSSDAQQNGRVNLVSGADDALVQGCTFTGAYPSVTIQSDRCRVIGNHFETFRLGVYLVGGAGNTVNSNNFVSVGGSGVVAGFDAILVETSTDVVISGNNILASREHGIYVAGGSSGINERVVITGNNISGVPQNGVKFLGATLARQHLHGVISSNVMEGTGSASSLLGISVGNSKHLQITGNVVTKFLNGIHIRGGIETCNVVGNLVRESIGAGIRIVDTSEANIDVAVIGNKVNDNSTAGGGWSAIDITCTGGYASSNIVIQDNALSDYQDVATQAAGVHVATISGGSTLATVIVKSNSGVGNTGSDLVAGSGLSSVTGLVARDNQGYVTEANGSATLASGTTSIAVTHGLDVTPSLHDISVTPIEAWGSATQFWITTPTSTQFTINVDQDPGQDVDFAWTASIQ